MLHFCPRLYRNEDGKGFSENVGTNDSFLTNTVNANEKQAPSAVCSRVNGGPRLTSAQHGTNRRQERPNKSEGDESIRITTAQSVMNRGGEGGDAASDQQNPFNSGL